MLQEIAVHAPVLCKLTITTADDSLSRKVEPHAPSSSQRFEAPAQACRRRAVHRVLMMPVLPFLADTDENVRTLVGRAADCGARFVYPAFGMTLRANQRAYYYDRLDELFPGLRERYEKKVWGTLPVYESARSAAMGRFSAGVRAPWSALPHAGDYPRLPAGLSGRAAELIFERPGFAAGQGGYGHL